MRNRDKIEDDAETAAAKLRGRLETLWRNGYGRKARAVAPVAAMLDLFAAADRSLFAELGPRALPDGGTAVRVADGDTIMVRPPTGDPDYRLRLYGIDAPELSQPNGEGARRFLAEMVSGEPIRYRPVHLDRYGRRVGIVYHPDDDGDFVVSVNARMVLGGWAWVAEGRWCGREICRRWREMEMDARRNGRGIWAAPGAVPPWEHRGGNEDD